MVIAGSPKSYAETREMLRRAIVDGGNTIFAEIDQAAAAASVGLTLRPTTLFVFGNPKGGTPLMNAFPAFALELPLKVLVWEDAGDVHIAYAPLKEAATRYGVSGLDDRITLIDNAVDAAIRKVLSAS